MQPAEPPTAPDALLARLQERGVVSAAARAVTLPGGVSNDVYALHDGSARYVVKHPLAQLRVPTEWRADTDRVVREGMALRIFGELTPESVPEVIDLDAEGRILTLEHAPPTWFDWREALLDERAAEPWIAAEIGRVVATWHRATINGERVPSELSDREGFHQLRIEPFHRRVAERHPELRAAIEELIDQLCTPTCLVHGDLSPKNILVGQQKLWILDAEVAHLGDPVFDLAFMHTHLLMKSIARPSLRAALARCASALDASYRSSAPALATSLFPRLTRHVGALLLARTDGRSPAGYLTPDQQDRVRSMGRSALCEDADPWTGSGTGRSEAT